MKFRKKPIVVDARRWMHIERDYITVIPFKNHSSFIGKCSHCGLTDERHGWVNTLEGGHIVCPGDWIITGIEGESYPCKPNIFEKTYEKVED